VRVIAATHRDLEKDVASGRFREDLYYRLKVVEVRLPALRERPEDLPALAEHFLAQVAERLGRERKRLGASAQAALAGYAWPGNARELRNVIEQSAVLASGEEIDAADLLIAGAKPPASGTAEELPFSEAKRVAVEGFERDFDDAFAGVRCADIGDGGDRPPPVSLDLGDDLRGHVGVEVVHDDRRAFAGEQSCISAAEATACAGDDRNLRFEQSHEISLMCAFR